MLKIAQFLEKCNKKFLEFTRTVRRRTSVLCGRWGRSWYITLIFMVKHRNKIWGLQINFQIFYLLFCSYFAPLNKLEEHKYIAPSIGISCQSKAIQSQFCPNLAKFSACVQPLKKAGCFIFHYVKNKAQTAQRSGISCSLILLNCSFKWSVEWVHWSCLIYFFFGSDYVYLTIYGCPSVMHDTPGPARQFKIKLFPIIL